MNVAGMLKSKGSEIVTANRSQTLHEIASTLAARKIGAILVTDPAGALIGIFSERDLVRAIAVNGAGALNEAIGAYMTKDVITCAMEDTVVDLMAKMTEGRFRHLPVVKDGRLCGVISIGDVVKRRIEETEHEVEAMRDYIASG